MTSWRGTPGTAAGTADVITSDQIVKTGSSITAFDDFGRVTDSTNRGDLADDNNVSNDNLCVHVDYADAADRTCARLERGRAANGAGLQRRDARQKTLRV